MTDAEFEESIKRFGHSTKEWARGIDRGVLESVVMRPKAVVSLEPAVPPGPKDPCWRCYYGDLGFAHTCKRYGRDDAHGA